MSKVLLVEDNEMNRDMPIERRVAPDADRAHSPHARGQLVLELLVELAHPARSPCGIARCDATPRRIAVFDL